MTEWLITCSESLTSDIKLNRSLVNAHFMHIFSYFKVYLGIL